MWKAPAIAEIAPEGIGDPAVTPLLLRADAFAAGAHAAVGQRRRYSGEPYIVHPRAVAELVRSVTGDEAMIAASLLHDVIEDTQATLEDIISGFGRDVATLVFWLTDQTMPGDGNRAQRRAMDRARLAKAPARAQTIKVADLIDNTASIIERDPKFAVVYLAEKAALLDVLTLADPTLLRRARSQVERAIAL